MERYNHPATIFVRAGQLVRVRQDENRNYVIEILSEAALRGILSRCARFVQDDPSGKEEPKPTDPSVKLVKDVLALPGWSEFAPISGIVTSPVMRPDGTVHDRPGYDPMTKTFYAGDLRLDVPEKPTKEEAAECARYILAEVFGDFPFADEASRANVLAALLTVVTKHLVGGNTPLGLIDKPQAGTGASLIAEIIAEITTGNGACMETCPDDDEEWRKAITSILMRGPQMVVLDNLSDTLKAPKLSQMLTACTWSDRLLGQNKIIDLPQTASWFVTGNNIQLAGDVARRSYWVRLNAGTARPWLREGFRHPDLKAWVRENRADLLTCLFVMVRAWIVAGAPKWAGAKLGSFEEWSSTIGGILQFAGIEGFLDNGADLYDNADQDVAQWDIFLGIWQALDRGNAITAAQLKKRLTDSGPGANPENFPFQAEMPAEIIAVIDKKGAVALGLALKKRVDQMFPSGRMLTAEKDSHTKGIKWLVKTVEHYNNKDKSSKDRREVKKPSVCGGLKKHESIAEGRFAEGAEGCSILRRFSGEGENSIEGEITSAPSANGATDSEMAKSNPPQIDRLIVVRFLMEVPAFVGLDGLTYGPFQEEDVASIPELQARGLFMKDAIVQVSPSEART
ncbi:hypothetical protein [Methanosaeta sp. UBA356]|uniref:DNA replication complex subunit Gins51 n=1 Tax=Methanosaeta sp. UBA356 TaxID=1915559 RepID=UPI00257A98CE|nr:hypothetical protein [Methanosaeta sp. UBA356]